MAIMEEHYSLSPEAWLRILKGLSQNKGWIAVDFNEQDINKENVSLFKKKSQAIEFVALCKDHGKNYFIFHATSMDEVYRHLSKIQQEQFISSPQNTTIMNEQNFDFLKNQLKYTGFGEELQRELREKMQSGEKEFTLNHKAKFGEDQVEATMNFKKGEQGDMFYFNRYFLDLKNDKGETALSQSFGIHKENNITLKEAYNLMNGRAVYKELTNKDGAEYRAWLQLNFKETNEFGDFKMKQFHDNYGYNLQDALARYPIKEMDNEQTRRSLMQSLEKGNRESINFISNGEARKVFIDASPQFKSINFYDESMKRVNAQTLSEKSGMGQSEKKESQKQEQKKGMNGKEEDDLDKRSKNKRRGQKIS